ncbi:biosynthetic-type acetolactate synthase large subunit [Veillonella sp. R32]|uniref:biosynthetic-type acetolactate synthase large subunit n=1 Tax=Veillonella sp. R32 TaxID=2021312 RepID=UPI001389CAB3|nr:biosynthetic-type acetolactate synthase large subunit [Veillonella sp. R32]KAF1682563.1 acetolactate synthase, large subunit, biosynthetic type [Veillonella sp. R32]
MSTDTINGARIVLETLHHIGITDFFGYPGGAVIPIYDEIYKYDGLTHYFARHEQGAAHEADGYARATGKCGVCLATSGPGATNLVTGLMTAHMDSVPVLAITGQVGRSLLGKDAFQESDIVGITMPITKNNYLVKSIYDLPRILREAHYIATTGRPGPVLVDIPKDVQLASISRAEFERLCEEPFTLEGYEPNYKGHPLQVKKAVALLKGAKKPLIIAGAGILKGWAAEELYELATKAHIPVTNTLLGLGSFPGQHELFLGMLGMHGTAAANFATDEADVVLAAGIRFDDRIAGNPEAFCKNAKIIHIDIDPAEIEKNRKVDVPIVGDVKQVLQAINEALPTATHDAWLAQTKAWKRDYALRYRQVSEDTLVPQKVLATLDELLQGDAIIVTDVGQHQMWVAQYFTYQCPNSIVTSGGAGTMGFGLPAAIGAQVGQPHKKVVLVVGDGGLQMTAHELMLIKQYNLPVKVVLLNNSYLGMVRQWQELFNDKRYSFVDLSVNPDFQTLAAAYGVRSVKIEGQQDLKAKLEAELATDDGVLIECIVEREENVYPMIPAGMTVADMRGAKGVADDGE